MDYGAAAPAYIDAFFLNIQWETVAVRMEKAVKAHTLLTAGTVR
jgi:Fe-Mn family superoxide dismutase